MDDDVNSDVGDGGDDVVTYGEDGFRLNCDLGGFLTGIVELVSRVLSNVLFIGFWGSRTGGLPVLFYSNSLS